MARLAAPAGLLLAVWVLTSSAAGATPQVVKPTASQHGLRVEIHDGRVVATGCSSAAACDDSRPVTVAIAAAADAARARREIIRLGPERRLVLVSAPAKQGPGRWVLLLGGSIRGEQSRALVLLKGFVDRPSGTLPGEHKRTVLLRERYADGEHLLLGKRFEHASICGRPSTMLVRELHATALRWQPGRTRALSAREVAAAKPLIARRLAGALHLSAPRLLHARLASSAVGRQAEGLTDGALRTAWSESRAGSGTGEFVVMSASAAVPITGFELTVRPESGPEHGAAPRRFYLATDAQLFEVTMPEDAWLQPAGTSYAVTLPQPIKSECVALVLDRAYARDEQAVVTIAELRATTAHDRAGGDFASLVALLDRSGDDSDVARALLLRSGPAAVTATIAGYRGLTPAGRRRALDVIDGGGCPQTAGFYVNQLVGQGAGKGFDPDLDPLARRARSRLNACRAAAAGALEAFIGGQATVRQRVWAARAMATIAPAAAVTAIAKVLGTGDSAARRGLRAALAAAADHARGRRALGDELAPARLATRSLVVRIDLLRALGRQISKLPAASAALRDTLAADGSFRTRYLLLGPAARLAAQGDAPALRFVRQSVRTDPDPHIRAHAAAVGGGVPALRPALAGALRDRQPRVRQAALDALAEAVGQIPRALRRPAIDLLHRDRWTFVRISAARALGNLGATADVEQALVAALDDDSPLVRRAALRSIGAAHRYGAAAAVEHLAADARQPAQVRAAALSTLGELCYAGANALLYKLALRAGFPELGYDQPLGLAALGALGAIKPPDLARKLAPLLGKDRRVPRTIRAIARDVISRPGRCHGKPAARH